MGCGRSAPKSELRRFVREGRGIVPDPAGKRPGRGAYLHPEPDCARAAVARRGFDRSFRAPISTPDDPLDLLDHTWQSDASTK